MNGFTRADELLQHLTEPQRQAVAHADGPLLVLAGPGSGKTRVITHRAAYLACTVTRPRHVLAITFTNKAAREMAERLDRLGVGRELTCSTFHSFCARLLRIHGERVGLRPNFSIFDESDQQAAMRDAIERVGQKPDNFTPASMLNVISKAKNDMISAETFAADAHGWQEQLIAQVYAAYEAVLAAQNAADFDDLLVKAARLLGDHADLREQLEDRYRYVLVDEYQDTNHAQYLLARGLCLQHENLCVTGDPDQSIYGWRGANLHNILQFEEDFPKAVVVSLEQNYRSTPQILAAADAVIRHNQARKRKGLWTENAVGPPVRVAQCDSHQAEAAFIAAEIRKHASEGGTYNQVAIFYRTNALSRSIEAALRSAQIPYQVARGVAFFQRKEIKDILAYLKVAANPLDQVALLRILNVPARGIGDTTQERLVEQAEQVGRPALEVLREPEQIPGSKRAAAGLRSFAELIDAIDVIARRGNMQETVEHVIHHSGLSAMWHAAEDESALENAGELVSGAAEYDRQHPDGSGSLADWLQQISLVADVDAVDPSVGAVTLMTLHAAKGLEFDAVFIAGVEDGLLPHERSRARSSDIEEERRLLFVGMTRAQRALTILCARYRDLRGVTRRTVLSPFLRELPEEGVAWLGVGEDGESRYDEAADAETDVAPDVGMASAAGFRGWRPGDYVRHPTYGIGRLIWVQPRGGRTHASVRFAAYGEKTFALELTKIERVEIDELD